MSDLRYPIRAVAKLTGLSVDTLRAWERRYQAITPDRNGHGRLYSEADIERLILLRKVVDRGHSISQIAPLPNEQLEALMVRVVTVQSPPKPSLIASTPEKAPAKQSPILSTTALHHDLQTLKMAIDRFDYAEIDRELSRLATLVTPRDLLQQILTPLMEEIGERWEQGNLTIAQEHMVSAAIRNLLGTLIRLFTRKQTTTTILFATPSGELHEFGILSAAALAAGGGLGIAYLGIDLPIHEIVEAAKKTAAQVLVLGLKGAVNPQESLTMFRGILRTLPESIELWVGGATAEEIVQEIKTSRAIYLADFHILEQHFIRVGAKY